mmetsp:Transcript_19091/g.27667  ORF Transcript_19091/g.27667 Transcript_19091/m.27667 type:complete len:241 (-) Transcript_19091:609-1331(-)
MKKSVGLAAKNRPSSDSGDAVKASSFARIESYSWKCGSKTKTSPRIFKCATSAFAKTIWRLLSRVLQKLPSPYARNDNSVLSHCNLSSVSERADLALLHSDEVKSCFSSRTISFLAWSRSSRVSSRVRLCARAGLFLHRPFPFPATFHPSSSMAFHYFPFVFDQESIVTSTELRQDGLALPASFSFFPRTFFSDFIRTPISSRSCSNSRATNDALFSCGATSAKTSADAALDFDNLPLIS